MKNKIIFYSLLVLIILVIIGGFVLVGNLIKVPYATTEIRWIKEPKENPTQKCEYITVLSERIDYSEKTLLDIQDHSIGRGDRLIQSINLDKGTLIELSFNSDDPLNIWVIDSYNWDIYVSKYKIPKDFLLKKIGIDNGNFDINIPETDTYYFDLKNPSSYEKKALFYLTIKTKSPTIATIPKREKVCHPTTEIIYVDIQKPVDIIKYRSLFSSWGLCNIIPFLCFN